MAVRANYPAFPATVMTKSRTRSTMEGLHVSYDNSVASFKDWPSAPGQPSRGMEAWFLFYGASNPEQFHVAVRVFLDHSKPEAEFWEVGVFDGVVRYYADYSNNASGAKTPNFAPNPNVSVSAHGSYLWMRFAFTADKDCEFYLDEKKLGLFQGGADNTQADMTAVWDAAGGNNCRLMEMHFTCPAGTGHKLFPIDDTHWLTPTPAASFSSGGYARFTGHFELTGSAD